VILQAQAKPATDCNRCRALGQSQITGHRSEGQAEAFESCRRNAVAARQCGGPQTFFAVDLHSQPFECGQRFVKVHQPAT
jgi:hypothetical protein